MAVIKRSPKIAVFNESETISEFRDKHILYFNIHSPSGMDFEELVGRWLGHCNVRPGGGELQSIRFNLATKISLSDQCVYIAGTGCAQ